MKNKIGWILIVLLLVGAGAFAYVKLKPGSSTNDVQGVVMIAGSPNYLLKGNKIRPFHDTQTLSNGTVVEVDGKVTAKDGKTFELKENELLKNDGTISQVDISQYSLEETNEPSAPAAGSNTPHGDYLDYSPEQVAKSQKEGKKVVLFFKAFWCPFCKAADKSFHEKFDQIPTNVAILKTDYDTSVDLKQKYAVTYQHTFVQIDEQGNLVSKWTGGDVENLKKFLK